MAKRVMLFCWWYLEDGVMTLHEKYSNCRDAEKAAEEWVAEGWDCVIVPYCSCKQPIFESKLCKEG